MKKRERGKGKREVKDETSTARFHDLCPLGLDEIVHIVKLMPRRQLQLKKSYNRKKVKQKRRKRRRRKASKELSHLSQIDHYSQKVRHKLTQHTRLFQHKTLSAGLESRTKKYERGRKKEHSETKRK